MLRGGLAALLVWGAGFTLAATTGTVLTSSVAVAQAISAIRVVGNRRVEPETVRSYMQLAPGGAYDPAKVDQSLKALFATGLFSDVRITREGSTVVVLVVENPVVGQVAFEGNKEVDDATLQGEVQLKPRSVYTRARVQADVQRILDVYRRQGLFAATVEPKLIELDSNRVNVVFEISEGVSTKVVSINFVGNRAFSHSQLRDVISTTQYSWLDFLKGNSIYDPDRVNLDRELLRQFYLKNGYADVRVLAGGAELARDGSGFVLTFAIDEGELYNIGTIRIESQLAGVDPATLQRELLIASGATYDAGAIDKTAERLTVVTAERGFAFARVRPRAERDPAGRIINLTFLIDQGPRIYIERIDITGNLRTKDHVIRREFRLAEGDAFNPLMVENAKKRLQALGFFKAVEVKRRQGSAQDRVVLLVELTEQSTGELSFGAGYSTADGVIGDISLSERNFLGNGQFLRLRLSGSLNSMQIDLSFTEPRFLDRNLSAGFDIFHREASPSSQDSFRTRNTGGSLRLGFPINEKLWFNSSYLLSRNELFDVDRTFNCPGWAGYRRRNNQGDRLYDDCSQTSRAIIQQEGVTVTSAIGTGLIYDGRNHPTAPTRGIYLSIGNDFAGVGGDVQYTRFSGEARGYYPITDKITLVGRITAGHILGWGGDDVRLVDMFYKGGETIRGFDRGGFGPRDLLTNDSLGGTTFYAATAEVRFPMPLLPPELGISGAFFLDAGSLFGTTDAVERLHRNNNQCGKKVGAANPANRPNINGICLADSEAIRVSTGTSLLWSSPLGPLRLDFGFALVKESYDVEQVFRFGASTRF
jgi:outer membrane protein insertion porin family